MLLYGWADLTTLAIQSRAALFGAFALSVVSRVCLRPHNPQSSYRDGGAQTRYRPTRALLQHLKIQAWWMDVSACRPFYPYHYPAVQLPNQPVPAA